MSLSRLWAVQSGPFISDLVVSPQQEAAEAAGCFDLAEHGFDSLLVQAVSAAPGAAFQFEVHRWHLVAGGDAAPACVAWLAVAGAARRQMAGDGAPLQGLQIVLVAEAGIGGEFLRLAPAQPDGLLDQRLQAGVVGGVRGQPMGGDHLAVAVHRDLAVVALHEAASGLQDAAAGIAKVVLPLVRWTAVGRPLGMALRHHAGGGGGSLAIVRRRHLGIRLQGRLGLADLGQPLLFVGHSWRHLVAALLAQFGVPRRVHPLRLLKPGCHLRGKLGLARLHPP